MSSPCCSVSSPRSDSTCAAVRQCLAIVEGQERTLRTGDFFYSPAGAAHVIVGAGAARCVVLMVGARKDPRTFLYPASEIAARCGASVEHDTGSQEEAYSTASGWAEARRSATQTTLGPIF